MAWGQRWNWLQRGLEELSEVMKMFYILIVVVIIWMNAVVKMYQTVHLKLNNFIHVYTFPRQLLPCSVNYICFLVRFSRTLLLICLQL